MKKMRRLISYIKSKLINPSSNDRVQDSRLLSFAPKIHKEDNQLYVDELFSAIQDENLTNIALSAPYCVGKSSIVKQLVEEKYSNNNSRKLRIVSLLTEYSDGGPNGQEKSGDHQEKPNDQKEPNSQEHPQKSVSADYLEQIEQEKISKEILKQLIYAEPPGLLKDMPYSRIGQRYPYLKILAASSLSSLLLLFILNFRVSQLSSAAIWLTLGIYSVLVIFLYYVISAIGCLLANKTISRFGFKDHLMIDLSDRFENFDQLLDCILYYFDKTGVTVVVFEDIDRLNNEKIYYSLRQLNIMINSAKRRQRKPLVTFVYAAKDDLISDPFLRTKFFDKIIPVIPFLSPDNAIDRVAEQFQSVGFTSREAEDPLRRILPVIARRTNSNIRVIDAIVNDVAIMRARLAGHGLDLQLDKIAAMATIKELEPKTYSALLQQNDNELNKIIKKCHIQRTKAINNIAEDTDLKAKLEAMQPEIVAYLREIFNVTLSEEEVKKSTISLDGESYRVEDFNKPEIWLKFYQADEAGAQFTISPYNSRTIPVASSLVKNCALSDQVYELITGDPENIYRERYRELAGKTFADFYKIYKPIPNGKLIDELVRLGLVDESYGTYLAPFIGKLTSPELINFESVYLRSRQAGYYAPLSRADVHNLLDRTDEIDWASPAFYNLYILDTVIADRRDDVLDAILMTADKEDRGQLFEFYGAYYNYRRELLPANTPATHDLIVELSKKMTSIYPQETIQEILDLGDSSLKLSVLATVLDNIDDYSFFAESGPLPEKYLRKLFLEYATTLTTQAPSLAIPLTKIASACNYQIPNLEFCHDNPEALRCAVESDSYQITRENLGILNTEAIKNRLDGLGCSEDETTMMLLSRDISQELKQHILQHIDKYSASFSRTGTWQTISALLEKYKTDLSYEQIARLRDNPSIDDYTIAVLLAWSNSLSREQILEILRNSSEEKYKKLSQPCARTHIPRTTSTEKLIKKLMDMKVVSTHHENEDVINVNNKKYF